MESYEKKYKELESKIKKAYLYAQTDSTKAVLEDILPELAESKDDRIRKEIIEYIKTGTYHKDWIAWLEKQGEQKAAEKLSKDQEYTLNRIVEYLEDNDCPEDWKDLLMGIHDTPYIKQKPADCSCVPSREMVLNVWELGNVWKELTKGSISTEHGTQLDYIVKHWKEGEHYIKSFEKQGEQNPAWSEEDDTYQSFAISAVEEYYDTKNSIQRGLIDWLKSLKGRVGCEANCTTTKELSESDEEEFQIAIDTLVEAGQRDSAHWLESIKQRIGG